MDVVEGKEKFLQIWGTMSTHWGISRAMAEIHGLLLLSNNPICAEEIMEQLKSVKIERDGNIGDRENTLAELVLENIKDVNMRRALVEVAIKSLGTLSQRNNKSYEVESKYEHLLETLINKPDMPFNKDFELKILFTVSNGNRSAIVNQKIQDIATVTVEDIYSPPLQEGLTVTPPVTAFEDMA